MIYRNEELKRLWKVTLYDGDPDDPDTPTVEETVIAWNQVDAINKCLGRKAAKMPEMICHVYANANNPSIFYRIDGTSGPSEEIVNPSIAPMIEDF
jgi:hypothetical protein